MSDYEMLHIVLTLLQLFVTMFALYENAKK